MESATNPSPPTPLPGIPGRGGTNRPSPRGLRAKENSTVGCCRLANQNSTGFPSFRRTTLNWPMCMRAWPPASIARAPRFAAILATGPSTGLSKSDSESLPTASIVASRVLLKSSRYSALVAKPFGGSTAQVSLLCCSAKPAGSGGEFAEALLHTLLCGDQVAELPGDVVGTRDRPYEQVLVGEVAQGHVDHVLATFQGRTNRFRSVHSWHLS